MAYETSEKSEEVTLSLNTLIPALLLSNWPYGANGSSSCSSPMTSASLEVVFCFLRRGEPAPEGPTSSLPWPLISQMENDSSTTGEGEDFNRGHEEEEVVPQEQVLPFAKSRKQSQAR